VLVSETLGDETKKVSYDATDVANFIKQRTVHSRRFKKLCGNLDKRHITLLLHTKIWWLSRGTVLNRAFEQKGELQDYFLESSRPGFAKRFEDEEWLEILAYFTHIFSTYAPVEQDSASTRRKRFDFKRQDSWI
jgi:hypothetical protein